MLGPGRQERSWIRGAQGGSASDLEALFKEHWPRAHRAAYLVVQDGAAAEDIAQEAFLSAIRNLDRFDRRRPFGPWLHRIVVNRAIDWARARSLRREISEAPGSEDFDTGDLGTFSDGVAAGLASLEPEQRAVIVLRYLLEYTPGGDLRAARPSSRDGQLPAAARARPARDDPRQGAAVSDGPSPGAAADPGAGRARSRAPRLGDGPRRPTSSASRSPGSGATAGPCCWSPQCSSCCSWRCSRLRGVRSSETFTTPSRATSPRRRNRS